ncbi:MAG: biotin/lipoyl-binding protein [Bacteroidetes bacterium]|nr:biotin/lipoyl-binding protein [Bacteroidota bacterium]MCW5896308.1 biotin/lipoyl-binding protein [Bacteroidota bacterium]
MDGNAIPISAQEVDERTFSVLSNGISSRVVVEKDESIYHMLLSGKHIEVHVESDRMRLLKKFASTSASEHSRTTIHAPMPALVVKVEVNVGDDVSQGQGLVVLEAMKMENEIKAHRPGKVSEIRITKGKAVEKGELLMVLE